MDKGLLGKEATRIYFHEKIDLIGFLSEWFGLELAKHFQVTINTPTQETTAYLVQGAYIVQLVPNGETPEQSKEYLGMLDVWIKNPSQNNAPPTWEWIVLETFGRDG